MARVIRISKEVELEVTHNRCGAVIGYYPKEVEPRTVGDYGGGSDTHYVIICPNCKYEVEVPRPKNM